MAEFKARLVDKDGNPLGTAANPLKISGGGSGTSDHTLLTNRDVASQHPASCITADTTNFNLNLSAADDTVQKALDTLDALIAGGGDVTISAKAKVALKKGQAVFITPGTAAVPDVDLCDNTNTAKSRVLGVMTADVASGATGSVRRYGTLTNVDTRTSNTNVNPNGETWVEGNLLFATTGGGLTKVRPTSGRCVKVGYSVTGSKATDTLVLFPMENPVWVTAAASEDVILRLGDNSGVTKVSIRDYANTEVASITSDGVISGNGSGLTGISGGGIIWTEVTGTSQAAAVDNGYIANNSALVTITLPSTCAVGKTIRVAGKGAGLWKVAQNAGQQIIFGNKNTTSGTSGYVAAIYQYDSVELLCITADTVFSVVGAVGDLDVV